jgi:hypothetical protein
MAGKRRYAATMLVVVRRRLRETVERPPFSIPAASSAFLAGL